MPIAMLLAIAAGGGVFIRGLYRDPPSIVAQAVAQDVISLAVVLPILIVAAVLASRGSPRARPAWLGGLVYVMYTYVVFAFDIRFNALFLRVWPIVTVWESRDALETMRRSGETPRGVLMFRAADAEPMLSIFDVIAHAAASV